MKEPKEEASLADQFTAATYVLPPFKNKLPPRVAAVWREVMLQYRIAMRHAHRFVLDDDMTEMVTKAAIVPAEKTLARLQYATLPYDTTWIEFNLHVKMRTIDQSDSPLYAGPNETDFSTVSPRLGMLLQRINDTDFVCTLIDQPTDDFRPGSIMPHVTCYLVSTIERDFNTGSYFGCRPLPAIDARSYGNEAGRMQAMEISKGSMWGYSTAKNKKVTNANDIALPPFLERHGDVGLSRMWHVFTAISGSSDALAKIAVTEMLEFTGHMRWLITLLAMLNEVPVSANHVRPAGRLRAGRTGKIQMADYHRLTLRLPKTNPLKYVERLLGSGRKRRAHEVRTHWRTYLHEQHCSYETHDWEFDHDNGYALCGKCMAYKRLIHEHIRGDASLGWVRKDYVLKPSE